mmetsp:Transcript_25898/g.86183  ORF Transcript_25898/g.86183 Transcript_25898/m.86183 type:complete len:253 (+) Transcript_25898:358-1116(+)
MPGMRVLPSVADTAERRSRSDAAFAGACATTGSFGGNGATDCLVMGSRGGAGDGGCDSSGPAGTAAEDTAERCARLRNVASMSNCNVSLCPLSLAQSNGVWPNASGAEGSVFLLRCPGTLGHMKHHVLKTARQATAIYNASVSARNSRRYRHNSARPFPAAQCNNVNPSCQPTADQPLFSTCLKASWYSLGTSDKFRNWPCTASMPLQNSLPRAELAVESSVRDGGADGDATVAPTLSRKYWATETYPARSA